MPNGVQFTCTTSPLRRGCCASELDLGRTVILVLLLLTPGASAFASSPNELSIVYDATATPVVVSAGETTLEGRVTDTLFLGGATRTRLEGIPELVLIERSPNGTQSRSVRDATVELSSGGLLWSGGPVELAARAPYAIGLALPQAPIPSEDGEAAAGFLVAGEGIAGTASWAGGDAALVPLDAVVTLRDADGRPLPEWDARRVNADSTTPDAAGDPALAMKARGAFRARIEAAIVGGATGEGADLALRVSPAPEDGFARTVALLDRSASSFAGANAPSFAGQAGPLALMEQVSGLLNGALLVIPGDGTSAAPSPREARWGTSDFPVGPVTLARGGDLAVAWRDGQMSVQGEPTFALGRDGFAVEPPARVGLFPVVSLVLWLVALAAIALFFARRPPKGDPAIALRLASLAAYGLVLVIALALWDRSFADTFGTSAIGVARAEGLSAATLPRIGVLAGVELVPWTIAAFLFALPVRIALGVALRYLGRGKSYKGIASAGGLVVLALLGPVYALWCVNLVWGQLARAWA